MAGKGEPKTVATTPAMTPPATLPAINTPTPATEAIMEDVATSTQTPDAQRRSVATCPSPKKTTSRSSPAKLKDDMTSVGPTIADLTTMVQQLRLENRHLEDQLAERKIEVEELRDDLRLLRRGLSAKMKRLFEATGHKDLY